MSGQPTVRLSFPELTVFLEDGMPEVTASIRPDYLSLSLVDQDGSTLLEVTVYTDTDVPGGASVLTDRLAAALEAERRRTRYRPLIPSVPSRPARRRPRRPHSGGVR
jgi:hypothetical protein